MNDVTASIIGLPKDPFTRVFLVFGGIGLVCAWFISEIFWSPWLDARPLPPTDIAQAPTGCVADLLKVEVVKAKQPLTVGQYRSIKEKCEQQEETARWQAESRQTLQRQRDALLGERKSTAN